jgi:hypothetical protein
MVSKKGLLGAEKNLGMPLSKFLYSRAELTEAIVTSHKKMISKKRPADRQT